MIDPLATPNEPKCNIGSTPLPPRRPIIDRLPGFNRRDPLPSLYDLYPRAGSASRRRRGLQVVPLERIVGTVRHPSQNTTDFLPLPYLRGRNWSARWQRIREGMRQLSVLPAIELMQVGDDYYVADGHNRVAAALEIGAMTIDADVTELVLPGTTASEPAAQRDSRSLVVGTDELRQAAGGRQSRTTERRSNADSVRREELAGKVGEESVDAGDDRA